MKKCTHKNHIGDTLLPLSSFSKRKSAKDGHQPWCKTCSSIIARNALEHKANLLGIEKPKRRGEKYVIGNLSHAEQLKRNNRIRRERKTKSPRNNIIFLLRNISARCKREDIPFNITVDDFDELPTHCPDLGVKLIYGNERRASPFSATMDKIIPALGYVVGNVRIISYRANTMKQNASLEEMKTIAESWIRLVDKLKS